MLYHSFKVDLASSIMSSDVRTSPSARGEAEQGSSQRRIRSQFHINRNESVRKNVKREETLKPIRFRSQCNTSGIYLHPAVKIIYP